jgi:hypothetical protein
MLAGSDGSSSADAIGLAAGSQMSQDLGIAPRYTMELLITVGEERRQ